MLDSRIPEGPLAEKWSKHKSNIRLVTPANKRLIDVIVVVVWACVNYLAKTNTRLSGMEPILDLYLKYFNIWQMSAIM